MSLWSSQISCSVFVVVKIVTISTFAVCTAENHALSPCMFCLSFLLNGKKCVRNNVLIYFSLTAQPARARTLRTEPTSMFQSECGNNLSMLNGSHTWILLKNNIGIADFTFWNQQVSRPDLLLRYTDKCQKRFKMSKFVWSNLSLSSFFCLSYWQESYSTVPT